METNKFNGEYEYMGYIIYNANSKHEWDIEPIGWNPIAVDKFKNQSECFKTIAAAKKWIKANGSQHTEEQYT
jgi:hypothetical protein